MEVRIEYYGQVVEITGSEAELLEVEEGFSVGEVLSDLESRYPKVKGLKLKCAVNSSFKQEEYILKSKDKISVMPPFSGG